MRRENVGFDGGLVPFDVAALLAVDVDDVSDLLDVDFSLYIVVGLYDNLVRIGRRDVELNAVRNLDLKIIGIKWMGDLGDGARGRNRFLIACRQKDSQDGQKS